MRLNVINMLNQASLHIANGGQNFAYDYALTELAAHLAAVRDGDHTWEEFAEAYCLTERDRKAKTAEVPA